MCFVEVLPLLELIRNGETRLRRLRTDRALLLEMHLALNFWIRRVRLLTIGHVLAHLERLILHIIRKAGVALRLLRRCSGPERVGLPVARLCSTLATIVRFVVGIRTGIRHRVMIIGWRAYKGLRVPVLAPR